jgi:hypothetical protein
MQKKFTFSEVSGAVERQRATQPAAKLTAPDFEEQMPLAETWMDRATGLWKQSFKAMGEKRGDAARKIYRGAGQKLEDITGISKEKLHLPTKLKSRLRSTTGSTVSFLGDWLNKDLRGFASASASALMSELRNHPFAANFQNAFDSGRNAMAFSSGKSNAGDKILDLALASRINTGPAR